MARIEDNEALSSNKKKVLKVNLEESELHILNKHIKKLGITIEELILLALNQYEENNKIN